MGDAATKGPAVRHSLFFFQAEDGIRDYKVTGVQTCALPISPDPTGQDATWTELGYRHPLADQLRAEPRTMLLVGAEGWRVIADGDWLGLDARSEERRVGKEGRSRWSPDH